MSDYCIDMLTDIYVIDSMLETFDALHKYAKHRGNSYTWIEIFIILLS